MGTLGRRWEETATAFDFRSCDDADAGGGGRGAEVASDIKVKALEAAAGAGAGAGALESKKLNALDVGAC